MGVWPLGENDLDLAKYPPNNIKRGKWIPIVGNPAFNQLCNKKSLLCVEIL